MMKKWKYRGNPHYLKKISWMLSMILATVVWYTLFFGTKGSFFQLLTTIPLFRGAYNFANVVFHKMSDYWIPQISLMVSSMIFLLSSFAKSEKSVPYSFVHVVAANIPMWVPLFCLLNIFVMAICRYFWGGMNWCLCFAFIIVFYGVLFLKGKAFRNHTGLFQKVNQKKPFQGLVLLNYSKVILAALHICTLAAAFFYAREKASAVVEAFSVFAIDFLLIYYASYLARYNNDKVYRVHEICAFLVHSKDDMESYLNIFIPDEDDSKKMIDQSVSIIRNLISEIECASKAEYLQYLKKVVIPVLVQYRYAYSNDEYESMKQLLQGISNIALCGCGLANANIYIRAIEIILLKQFLIVDYFNNVSIESFERYQKMLENKEHMFSHLYPGEVGVYDTLIAAMKREGEGYKKITPEEDLMTDINDLYNAVFDRLEKKGICNGQIFVIAHEAYKEDFPPFNTETLDLRGISDQFLRDRLMKLSAVTKYLCEDNWKDH